MLIVDNMVSDLLTFPSGITGFHLQIPGPSIKKQVWKEDKFNRFNSVEFLLIFKGSFLLHALGHGI